MPVVVGCFVVLHAILQRRLRSELLRRHNDVAGFLFSAVGVLYAVVLGFVVVVVWQKYDAAVANVENEVDATGEPLPRRRRLSSRTSRADSPRSPATTRRPSSRVEWPAMERDQDVPEHWGLRSSRASPMPSIRLTRRQLQRVRRAAGGDCERTAALRRAARAADRSGAGRSRRCSGSRLIVGALSMVAFCYIFGVENRPAQLMMTAILVGLIGILFVVIDEFSTPFSGSVRISDDGWVYLQQRLPDIR